MYMACIGIMCIVYFADTVFDAIVGADLLKKLPRIFTSYGSSGSLELLNNSLTLTRELCMSGKWLVTGFSFVWEICLLFCTDNIQRLLSDSMELRKSLEQLKVRDDSDEVKKLLENVLQVIQQEQI